MLSINDVYILDNYASFAAAVQMHRKLGATLGCVVTSHMNGDFLSPCMHTALDGGTTMMQGLNYAKLDYVCCWGYLWRLTFIFFCALLCWLDPRLDPKLPGRKGYPPRPQA